MNKPITLTTDFSFQDPYIGSMKGVLLSVNPNARITDIAHQLGAQETLGAAFVLKSACGFFPSGTIHVAVIDPGVGGERAPVIIETERYMFVGPDNGIFSLALDDEEIVKIIRITNKEYFLDPVSPTFHGRDIFAPVAGHLSLGVEASLMGEVKETLEDITLPAPVVSETLITGEVIHIDGFGNLITNISKENLEGSGKKRTVEIRGSRVLGIVESYSQVESGNTLCALIGSAGLMEIALNMGSAKERLNAEVGDKVLVNL